MADNLLLISFFNSSEKLSILQTVAIPLRSIDIPLIIQTNFHLFIVFTERDMSKSFYHQSYSYKCF